MSACTTHRKHYLVMACSFSRIMIMAVMITLASSGATVAAPADDSVEQVDVKIAKLLDTLNQREAPDKANDKLVDYLQNVCRNPQMFLAPLKRSIKSGLDVTTSPDKKVRIYDWDSQTGGTMIFNDAIVQYQAPGKKQSEVFILYPEQRPANYDGPDDPDPGYFYKSIIQMHTADGRTVYLATGHGKYSSIDRGSCIQAFSIEKGQLVKTPFFQTTKKVLSEINCNLHDNPSKDNSASDDDIELVDHNKTLKIPLLKDDGISTGKFLIYKFDGYRFVFQQHHN